MGWRDLGVLEVTVPNRPFHCTDLRVLTRRPFDCAYTDIPEAAVINADVFRCVLRFHLNPIGSTVCKSQIRNGDSFAAADTQNDIPPDFAVPPFAAEGDLGRTANSATDSDVFLLPENDWPL